MIGTDDAGELAGRVALVTGSADGIGRAIARALAERGAAIMLHDIKADVLARTADEIRTMGAGVAALGVDIRDRPAVQTALDDAVRELGGVDILVNNAGVGLMGPGALDEVTEEDFDRMFAVHVKGAFQVTQMVVPGMKQRGYGRIVNIASNRGQVGFTSGSHYSGAKAALIGLTKAWAKELAPAGILVNAIAPGVVKTPMTMAHGLDAIREEADDNLLKRWAEPEEIAATAAFLVSGSGAYYTGQVLCPNGGDPVVGI